MFNQLMLSLMFAFMHIAYGLYLPCVDFNKNCYYNPCCEPYICYEETVCIGMNNITNMTNMTNMTNSANNTILILS